EDGIRDLIVTGVQTCALPISGGAPRRYAAHRLRALPGVRRRGALRPGDAGRGGEAAGGGEGALLGALDPARALPGGGEEDDGARSEERRVGKECSARGERRAG